MPSNSKPSEIWLVCTHGANTGALNKTYLVTTGEKFARIKARKMEQEGHVVSLWAAGVDWRSIPEADWRRDVV